MMDRVVMVGIEVVFPGRDQVQIWEVSLFKKGSLIVMKRLGEPWLWMIEMGRCRDRPCLFKGVNLFGFLDRSWFVVVVVVV